MAVSPYVPGAANEAPLLEQMAQPAFIPPENFVGNIIFPDQQVASFIGLAPIRGNEELEINDDDTIGLKADFPEVTVTEDTYNWELGHRGRKVIIGQQSIIKAAQAKAMARGNGDTTSDPVFDLEARLTSLIVAQDVRRGELLKIGQLTKTSNYAAGHVLPSIEIDTIATTAFLQTMSAAAALVESAGRGPATHIVFGGGAWDGAMTNQNFTDLLPDTAYKILTAGAFKPLLKLPDDAQPTVLLATATYKTKKKATPIPMMNHHIWVGRVAPGAGRAGGFGNTFWHPMPENGKKNFVYRIVQGSQRNVHISIEGYSRPLVNDKTQGVLIPVTLST